MRPAGQLPAGLRAGRPRVRRRRQLHAQARRRRDGQRLPPQPQPVAGRDNVFADPGRRELHVSETARHALGGLLEHAPGMLARAGADGELLRALLGRRAVRALRRQLGLDNRTCAVRVSANGRLEFKLPDAMVNPYLSHTAILAAMADGLERRLDPGPPQSRSSYEEAVVADATRPAGSGSCRAHWATRSPRWTPTRSSAARCRTSLAEPSSQQRPTSGSASAGRSRTGTGKCTCGRSHDAHDRQR